MLLSQKRRLNTILCKLDKLVRDLPDGEERRALQEINDAGVDFERKYVLDRA